MSGATPQGRTAKTLPTSQTEITVFKNAERRRRERRARERDELKTRHAVGISPEELETAMLKDLARSGLDRKDLKLLQLQILTAQQTETLVGKARPSYKIPYFDSNGKLNGYYRVRFLNSKKGKFAKLTADDQRYSQPADTLPDAYLPPIVPWSRVSADPTLPITITEGEKKAAIACKLGFLTLGLGGVWSFMAGKRGLDFLPQLEKIVWKGRVVEICYDGDLAYKSDVRAAILALAGQLFQRGARVSKVILPPGTKLDDFLLEKGYNAYLKLPREQLNNSLPEALRNLTPMPSAWYDNQPPAAEYIIDPYLQVAESAVVAGVGGVGKGYFLLPMLVAVCTGTEFYGYRVAHKRRAMYLMLERSQGSFRRRLHKVMHALEAALPLESRKRFRRDLLKHCYAHALAGEQLQLIEFRNQQWAPSAIVDALIAEINAAGIEVMFLDPMSRLHGAPENDNSAMSALTKALERIIQATGCSIVLVHHAGKNGTGDQYGFRGGSAIGDNTSEMIVLTKVEPAERDKLNLSRVPEEERRNDIICVRHARCSDARPAPDLYLLRSADGVLVDYDILPRSAQSVAEDRVPALRKWANGREFTRNEFVMSREQWGDDIAKHKAEELFNELVRCEVLTRTGEKRRGGELVKFASLPGDIRETGKHRKKAR